MIGSWCKVASNLDSHPRIRKAGRDGREVFLFALRCNAEPGHRTPGRISAERLDPDYLSDILMSPRDACVTGVTAAVTAGLLVREGDFFVIVGWENGWGKDNGNGAERTARWRENKRLSKHVTPCDVTDVTRDGCDTDQIRSDQKRIDKISEKNSAAPSAGGSVLGLTIQESKPKTKRKPKPFEPTADERMAVSRVLEKLSSYNGVRYTCTDEHSRLIVTHLRGGLTELDLRKVAGYCALELWRDKPEMHPYLRPETLFGPKTISKYLDPARTWFDSLPEEQKPAPSLANQEAR